MKNSKEQYIQPVIEIIFLESEEVIASSLDVNEEEIVTGPGRARSIWDRESQ